MALEDFFTLTEMKDGLTVRARVEELVDVMNKEKDCAVKNIGDAMRQWSTVASAIAVTEDKECLDLFIQLDGLLFIDRWLKDAQKFSADTSDCSIEESTLALLQALEKLKIDNEKLTSSGICFTVRDLLNHKSSNIQDKAKSIFGSLKLPSVSGAVKLDSDEARDMCDGRIEPGNMLPRESDTAISCDQKTDIDKHVHQFVGDNAVSSGCSVDQHSEGSEAVVKEPDQVAAQYPESDHKDFKDKFESSVRKEACSLEQKSVSDCADAEQGTDFKKEGRRLESLPEVNAEIHNERLTNKVDKSEVYSASITPNPVETSSSLDRNNVVETHEKAVSVKDIWVDSSTMKILSPDLQTGENSSRGSNRGVLMNCTKTLQDSHVDGSMLVKSNDLGPQSEKINSERMKHDTQHHRDSSLFESSKGRKSVDVTSKMSAVDLESGTVDALEVACLVAKEVIEDYDEQFNSFSRKSSFHESPVEKMTEEDSPGEGESSSDSSDVDVEQENCTKVAESSQVTEMAPEADKGNSNIDLNLDISSEAEENAGNSVSNPVAVISTAVPGLSASPPKFEGDLGWKGSAATSAFRPAPPRRASEGDKTVLLDLNVLAEDGDDKTAASPRKSQKLSFDLNQMSEDGDAPLSTSFLKPSSLRNFDLNDRPSDESVISIMGTKVKKNNTFIHQAPFSFFNGGSRASEPVSGPTQYAPPPIYSYNGIPMRPPAMQYFHPMYGPTGISAAQMLDSRVSMMPQFMAAPPPSYASSFPTNMISPLPSQNGASSSRSQPSFNSGFVIDGANRGDTGGFRQFVSGQVRSAEDHNNNLQQFFPGIVGGKRKEPDGGWEPYMTNYKHQQPPHL